MLWRACRGNVFLRQAEIETPLEDPSTVSINYIQGPAVKPDDLRRGIKYRYVVVGASYSNHC